MGLSPAFASGSLPPRSPLACWSGCRLAAWAQIRVHPTGVNVNSQGATTVFLTFGGLTGYRPVEALWCGRLVPAAPDVGLRCDPSTILGSLPVRYDQSTRATGSLTDIMSIPPSVVRRAYQAAEAGRDAGFFYVRRFASVSGGGADQFVAVTCRMAGGGARVPFSLIDVELGFEVDEPVLYVRAGDRRARCAGHAHLQRHRPPARTLGSGDARRGTADLARPADRGHAAARGARVAAPLHRTRPLQRVPAALDARLHAARPRSTAPADERRRLLLPAAAHRGERRQGGRLEPGERRRRAGRRVERRGGGIPAAAAALRRRRRAHARLGRLPRPVICGCSARPKVPSSPPGTDVAWLDLPQADVYRVEFEDAGHRPVFSALVPRGIGAYRLPPVLSERAPDGDIRWRVVAVDAAGRDIRTSAWRRLRLE